MKKIAIFLLSLVAFGAGFYLVHRIPKNCIEVRGAFDLGAADVRLNVSRVDVCRGKLLEQLSYETSAVSLLTTEKDSITLSENYLLQTQAAVADLVSRSYANVDSYSGVAAGVFQKAKNWEDFLKSLGQQVRELTGKAVRFEVITPRQEAELGVLGASARLNSLLPRTIVWDLATDGQKFSVPNADGSLLVHETGFSSGAFKSTILRQVKKNQVNSPNPLTHEEYLAAKALAVLMADEVPFEIRKSLSDPSAQIVGIGEVFYGSVRKSARVESRFNRRNIMQAIVKRLELTDEELGGPQAAWDTSQLVLVDAYMDHLGIEAVHALNVDMTDGVLVSEGFWD